METFYTTVETLDRDDCEYLSKTFDSKKYVNKGACGQIFQVCNIETKNCNYILKVIVYDKDNYELSGSMESKSRKYIKNEWQKEVRVMKKINCCQEKLRYKFSPKIYDNWFCTEETKTYFYILMEKYDDNLFNFITRLKSPKVQEETKALAIAKLESLEKDLNIIHDKCGICLNDIKLENILYKQVDTYKYDFVFTDFGKSSEDVTVKCMNEDRDRFQRSINMFHEQLKNF